MVKVFFLSGTIAGILSVILGAFAAHGLKNQLSPEQMLTFKTAVDYQFIHGLALILVALTMTLKPEADYFSIAGLLLLVGILLFSGSLYLLLLTGVKMLGIITPVGGVAFILGWIYFSIAVWKSF